MGHIHALRIAQSRAAVPPPPPGPATGSGARTVRSARELQGAAREPEAIREPGEVRETREVREPGEVRATRATEEIRPEVWAEGGGPGAGPAERPGSRPPARPETGWPGADDIAPFLQFGPLGTALLPGRERPRALLIDEIDKSDLDLPSDLLDVLERGEFKVPELVRHSRRRVGVRRWPGDGESDLPERLMRHPVENGHVRCDRFPFIVMTSNGEREFPAPFLRRCIRYDMPPLTPDLLRRAVEAHLGQPVTGDGRELIEEFVRRVAKGEALAVDQLLNAVRIVTDERGPRGEQRARLLAILLRELSGA
ncbi:hypothetical protein NX801_24035 [Streptomyces sp. LP05-1]|uniref:Uncharacterized protein n=1 Tax=Streptomyces pyxinae TaxID=2970734 RepID=A0ABT2CMM3_9ACTN|nr:hypothetical protein [Streptomyces sp. LP05-1]